MYINSTVLDQIVGSTITTTLYVLGAAGSIALLFFLPNLVQHKGLVKISLTIFAFLGLSLLILGITHSASVFATTFVIYSILTSTIWYCNDMLVSHYAKPEMIGRIRGTYLTVINTAIAIMPIIAGFLIVRKGFSAVYILSAIIVVVGMVVVMISQRHFKDRAYSVPDIRSAWKAIIERPSLRRVVALNFLLQFFYGVMTIYSPLYLLTVMHYNWKTVGIIFSIMLTAFIIFQYPIGKWSDKVGQKTLLIIGLLIATISTALFGGLKPTLTIVAVIAILFCTRIGISMFEVMTESYFFKQITDKDEGIISIYRMMYPLAYIITPLFGWVILLHHSYNAVFIALSVILCLGLLYSFRLKTVVAV